jgi:Icc-related predicted phosphoesterase
LRLFYSGDIHGSERCFRKFLNAASFYQADVLILGGDITGKIMVPIVEYEPERFVANILGRTEKAKRERDLDELTKRIRFNGFYPYKCGLSEYERLEGDATYQAEVMADVMVAEVRRWMRIADEKLTGQSVKCLIMPGNDDDFGIDDALGSEVVENPEGRVVWIDGYQLLSSAWANPTPWDSPREADEDHLGKILDEIAAGLDRQSPSIFNLHVPPYDSGLDTAPELDPALKLVTSGGQPNTVPVGSRAVRDLIERHQPVVGLHGHVHESKNVAWLGRTLCINPGSSYGDGVLDGAIVELDGGEITRYQLVSG